MLPSKNGGVQALVHGFKTCFTLDVPAASVRSLLFPACVLDD